MKCPFCDSLETEVVETRDSEDLAVTRRRRECLKCKKRFTTYERVENIPLLVIKKDGRREPFSRDKLREGIVKACQKRPVSMDLIESLVDEIERELRGKETNEISSKTIGNMVLRKLKKIDKVAYLRYASVYLDFSDLSDFEEMIEKLT
ncbi:transcriptional repressor NrdR [Candidatus Gottesmanbacteria bacterium]|nr:transcriptional repressor NrdR [Candidatus Gottesmanbacteria bacterium]MBI5465041.1 transcriptional repressor NrdR [Candidatus Gottesmanbacteria bacterium]